MLPVMSAVSVASSLWWERSEVRTVELCLALSEATRWTRSWPG